MKNYLQRNQEGGYSLIEMMVSVTLFTIVAMVSISTLISLSDANRKAQSMRIVIDNLNFALENISRNLRVGSDYSGVGCGSSGCTGITFKSSEGVSTTYSFSSNNAITKNIGNGEAPITSKSQIYINNLKFNVVGIGNDNVQPRVLITVKGTATSTGGQSTSFHIQTTATQRLPENVEYE